MKSPGNKEFIDISPTMLLIYGFKYDCFVNIIEISQQTIVSDIVMIVVICFVFCLCNFRLITKYLFLIIVFNCCMFTLILI